MHLLRPAVAAACIAPSAPGTVAGPALDAMIGRWVSRSCYDAGEWRVYGSEIEFAWPGRAVDVERVLSESGNRVETVGISREIDARYTYIVSEDRNTAWIRNHRDDIDQIVRRCR